MCYYSWVGVLEWIDSPVRLWTGLNAIIMIKKNSGTEKQREENRGVRLSSNSVHIDNGLWV